MQRAVLRNIPYVTSALALACVALAFMPEGGQLAFERHTIIAGQFWRAWTGHLVHFSSRHLLLDVGTLLLVGTVAECELGFCFTGGLVLLGMPIISLGLLVMVPNLIQYRGASGLDMLLACSAGTMIWHDNPKARGILAIAGIILIAKSVIDVLGIPLSVANLPPDVHVVWQAHVLGAAIGWLAANYKLKREPLREARRGSCR